LSIEYVAPPENRFGCPTHASITLRGKAMHGVKLMRNSNSGFDIQIPSGNALELFEDTELEPIRVSEEGENPVTSARRRRRSHTVDSVTKSNRQVELFEGLYCLSLATPLVMVLGLVSLKPKQYERIGLCVLELRGNSNPWKEIAVSTNYKTS
jgi:hypothetical protein